MISPLEHCTALPLSVHWTLLAGLTALFMSKTAASVNLCDAVTSNLEGFVHQHYKSRSRFAISPGA